jgi:hypothetical protein
MKKITFLILGIILLGGCKKETTPDPSGTNTMTLNYTVSDGWAIPLYKGIDQAGTVARCPYVKISCGIYDADLNFVFWAKQGTDLSFADWCGNIVGGGGEMVNLGYVKGLGEVTTKPTSGWSDKSAVEVGHGYVLRFKNSFDYSNPSLENVYYRMYVTELLKNTYGGIIGAKVKYQGPF